MALLLKDAIRDVAGRGTVLVDSASTTADVVRQTLNASLKQRAGDAPGSLRLLATDGATRFARVGGRFLGQALKADSVEVVDL